jgi:hypothetical protein
MLIALQHCRRRMNWDECNVVYPIRDFPISSGACMHRVDRSQHRDLDVESPRGVKGYQLRYVVSWFQKSRIWNFLVEFWWEIAPTLQVLGTSKVYRDSTRLGPTFMCIHTSTREFAPATTICSNPRSCTTVLLVFAFSTQMIKSYRNNLMASHVLPGMTFFRRHTCTNPTLVSFLRDVVSAPNVSWRVL